MSFAILLQRLLHLVPVMLGVSFIVFMMMSLAPGDPVEIMLSGQNVTQEQVDALRHDMGLDLPLGQRFIHFLGRAAQGDFGLSFFHQRPVMEVILERLPATIELTLISVLIALLMGIPLGVIAAVKKHSFIDRLASVTSLFGISMPGFWFGILLLLLFGVHLQWLPVSGRIDFSMRVPVVTHFLLIDSLIAGSWNSFWDAVKHLLLPATTLGLAMSAVLMSVTRTAMIQSLGQDYILFAYAKGLSPRRVVFLHALKNALITAVTVAALETGSLLGGNMIVESVFGWPGLGRLVVEAIYMRNYPLVQAAVLIYALIYVLINFGADFLYTVLDPRVKFA